MNFMKKLLFSLLLGATQLFYASELPSTEPTLTQLSPDITITLTRSTNQLNGQLIVRYTYHNPSSVLSSSTVSHHIDGSHTTHDIYRDNSSRTSHTDTNGLESSERLHRIQPLQQNTPSQVLRGIVASQIGFSSAIRPIPPTRQLTTGDDNSRSASPLIILPRSSNNDSPMDSDNDIDNDDEYNFRPRQR